MAKRVPRAEDVVFAGIGQVPVGEHWSTGLRTLAVRAATAALRDSGNLKPDALYVGNQLAALISRQNNLGALLAESLRLEGVEAYTVEAAGAGGAGALRMASMAVASGYVDTALVVGVEKFTDQGGSMPQEAVAHGADYDYELALGMTLPNQAALLQQRYMHEYGVDQGVFQHFTRIARTNATHNPNAFYGGARYRGMLNISGNKLNPTSVTLGMAPFGDGAAAVVLTRGDLLPPQVGHPVVRLTASSVAIDTLALHDRPEPLLLEAAGVSVRTACRKAGILPEDVDFIEITDSFAIFAVLSLEAAGFAGPGEGIRLAIEDVLGPGGRLPMSTMGGFGGRGNPLGAAGVYQVVEAVMQLRGEAGQNQVPDARRALVQTLGGPASTAVTHILERIS